MPTLGAKARAFDERWKLNAVTGCHEWQGSVGSHGYGQIKIGSKVLTAHRFAYQRAFGTFEAGAHVLHRCDNRRCVNPQHLFLGTAADNMRDMAEKGRARGAPPRGARNPASKLVAGDIERIHDLSRNGCSARSIGRYFGVSDTAIRKIITGQHWSVPCQR